MNLTSSLIENDQEDHVHDEHCNHSKENSFQDAEKKFKEEYDLIYYLSLLVKNQTTKKLVCYGCNKEVFFNGKTDSNGNEDLVLDLSQISKIFYDKKALNYKEFINFTKKTNCVNCGNLLLIPLGFPINRVLYVTEEDLVYKIAPQYLPKIVKKQLELVKMHKMYAIQAAKQEPVKFLENYLLNDVLLINEKDLTLSIPCIEKTVNTNEQKHIRVVDYLRNLILPETNQHTKIQFSLKKAASFMPDTDSLSSNVKQIDVEKYNQYKSFLFLDIDGTSTKGPIQKSVPGKVSLQFFKFLAYLDSKGYLKTIINSGRPIEWATMMLKDLGIKNPLCICSNGTEILYLKKSIDLEDSQVHITRAPIRNLLEQIINILQKKYNVHLIKLSAHGSSPEVMVFDKNIHSAKFLEKLINEDEEIKEFIEEHDLERVTCTESGTGIIHLSSIKYSKGSAAQKIMQALKIDKKLTFNIGDHLNDIPLTTIVGTSYCVSNGIDEYKQKAHHVCKQAEAKGAIEAVKHFLISNQITTEEDLLTAQQEVINQNKLENDYLFN